MAEKYPCPCCGYLVFDEPPGSFDICPICFWEDDIVQLAFPRLAGGANKASLSASQQNYIRAGVIEPRLAGHVRKPTKTDVRDPKWRPFDPKRDPNLAWERREDHQRWEAVKDNLPPMPLYYWRTDYWLAMSMIKGTVARAIDSFAGELPAEQLDDMRKLVRAGEPGVALENLCTQIREYDVAVHSVTLLLLVAAGTAMGIKPRYWDGLRTQ